MPCKCRERRQKQQQQQDRKPAPKDGAAKKPKPGQRYQLSGRGGTQTFATRLEAEAAFVRAGRRGSIRRV